MEVVRFLREHGESQLQETYSIRIKKYDRLMVLNYDQYASPKFDSVVKECRGLILENGTYRVVSRAFDRFFNHGEDPRLKIDWKSCRVFEKVDGSLIKIYHYDGRWHASTRGTAFAEGPMFLERSFRDFVDKALASDFETFCSQLDKELTYIFELTAPENQIVTRYDECSLWFLAARRNDGEGRYVHVPPLLGVRYPRSYRFATIEECLEAARTLPDLREGYVVYASSGPIVKIKSPAYVAAHLARDKLTSKHICEMIANRDHEEYLNYFPDHGKYFTPYIERLEDVLREAEDLYDSRLSRKELAALVLPYRWSWIAFAASRAKRDIRKTFRDADIRKKANFLIKITAEDPAWKGTMIGESSF